jgi:alpha-D-ribose 1-methylphosphonate 5-triphosphate diphosphatase
MHRHVPPLRLTGGTVLMDGTLHKTDLSVAAGVIGHEHLPEIDVSGYYVLPGIVDLHGDAFERHIAPRPTAPFDMVHGLASADREAASCGITTAFLAQGWSWDGGIRSPGYAEDVMRALETYRPQALCDLRIQLRYETHMVSTENRFLQALRRFGVTYVVFNNHLPEALDEFSNDPVAVEIWARKHGRTTEQHVARMLQALKDAPEVSAHLARLACAMDRLGTVYGSHDDGDPELRRRYSEMGAQVAEFPTTFEAARRAVDMDDPVIMGAPNVVRGGSQSGNIAAVDLIREGLCHALVSDYYYPALPQAVWSLVDHEILDLPGAWAMVSSAPADILGLKDRGRIKAGSRADLVLINADTRAIEATISGGRIAALSGALATRFLARLDRMRVAAE